MKRVDPFPKMGPVSRNPFLSYSFLVDVDTAVAGSSLGKLPGGGASRHVEQQHSHLGEPRGSAAGDRWFDPSLYQGEQRVPVLDAIRERLGAGKITTGIAYSSCTEIAGEVCLPLVDRGNGELVEQDTRARHGRISHPSGFVLSRIQG